MSTLLKNVLVNPIRSATSISNAENSKTAILQFKDSKSPNLDFKYSKTADLQFKDSRTPKKEFKDLGSKHIRCIVITVRAIFRVLPKCKFALRDLGSKYVPSKLSSHRTAQI